MKPRLLIFLSFFISQLTTAQDSTLFIKQTDSIVAGIDKATGITGQFRRPRSQVYEYKTIADSVVKVTLQAKQGATEVKQTFYQYHGRLLFAIESENSYYLSSRDTVRWGGTYYFNSGSLIHYATLGHGKSETEEWDPQKEVLASWQKAKAAVLAHLKRKTVSISRQAP